MLQRSVKQRGKEQNTIGALDVRNLPETKNDNNKDCVGLITKTAKWNVYDCTTSMLDYVCEKNGKYW